VLQSLGSTAKTCISERPDAIARADELFALPTKDTALVLSKEVGWFDYSDGLFECLKDLN